ncbi:MAG: restriction endonuclease subunit R [Flavobacteriaceae bacterium]|nr:MAG: restriction endonuclease subunit R [Flavobacteriaceae bacterium]
MQQLNLPPYKLKVKSSENKLLIFDIVRKKYIVLTPEEWVRQHYIHYLVQEKKYPISLIAVEKQLKVNTRTKRTDIVIYNRQGTPEIIVECKAPSIKISQHVFDQIARYNMELKAPYLIVTNGMFHYYCRQNFEKKCYEFLRDIPEFKKK